MLEDNFCYYVHPSNDITKGFYVDVAEPAVIQLFINNFDNDG